MDKVAAEQQFTDLYEREVDAIFRYTLLRVSSREEAMDITHDVFSSLWAKLQLGEEVREGRAFLYTSARNRIIDWYRKHKPLSLESLGGGNEEDGPLPFDPVDPLAETRVQLSAEAEEVLTAIASLPPQYQESVYLRFVEEYTPQEIAQILGSSPNIISIRISRGLTELRKRLIPPNEIL